MIVVHHLDDSRSQRILWLLEELQVPYEVQTHKRSPQTRLAPAELKNIHPLGKSPVIQDDRRVVAESGAIIEYVLRHYGRGQTRSSRLLKRKPFQDSEFEVVSLIEVGGTHAGYAKRAVLRLPDGRTFMAGIRIARLRQVGSKAGVYLRNCALRGGRAEWASEITDRGGSA